MRFWSWAKNAVSTGCAVHTDDPPLFADREAMHLWVDAQFDRVPAGAPSRMEWRDTGAGLDLSLVQIVPR